MFNLKKTILLLAFTSFGLALTNNNIKAGLNFKPSAKIAGISFGVVIAGLCLYGGYKLYKKLSETIDEAKNSIKQLSATFAVPIQHETSPSESIPSISKPDTKETATFPMLLGDVHHLLAELINNVKPSPTTNSTASCGEVLGKFREVGNDLRENLRPNPINGPTASFAEVLGAATGLINDLRGKSQPANSSLYVPCSSELSPNDRTNGSSGIPGLVSELKETIKYVHKRTLPALDLTVTQAANTAAHPFTGGTDYTKPENKEKLEAALQTAQEASGTKETHNVTLSRSTKSDYSSRPAAQDDLSAPNPFERQTIFKESTTEADELKTLEEGRQDEEGAPRSLPQHQNVKYSTRSRSKKIQVPESYKKFMTLDLTKPSNSSCESKTSSVDIPLPDEFSDCKKDTTTP